MYINHRSWLTHVCQLCTSFSCLSPTGIGLGRADESLLCSGSVLNSVRAQYCSLFPWKCGLVFQVWLPYIQLQWVALGISSLGLESFSYLTKVDVHETHEEVLPKGQKCQHLEFCCPSRLVISHSEYLSDYHSCQTRCQHVFLIDFCPFLLSTPTFPTSSMCSLLC